MKIRDSGMPEETMWASFFNVNKILDTMQINESITILVEIGCGYGTFTVETTKRIKGKLYAFDIEPEMIEFTKRKAEKNGLSNIDFRNREP